MFKLLQIVLISHASKVMLKILQVRFQQCVYCELPDVLAGYRKGRGTRDRIAKMRWIIQKAREFQTNNYFCFIDYAKAFDGVDHNKLWKILNKMGIPDHLTCLLRNLYAVQEATFTITHGTRLITNWKRSMLRLYIVTLFILLICRVYFVKCQAAWSTTWNQDCPGEISITSDMQMTSPLWQKTKKN